VLGEKLLCDRYVLEEKLGSGALGDLYRATDTQSNRAVAVRLVTEIGDPLALSAFYRQWAIQAGLRHDNVGAILDITEVIEDNERFPVIVTPLIEGTALCDLFVQPLSGSDPRDWLACVESAAWGIQAAHERGLFHGRLHSGNVLVERGGGVRVVDFGTSNAADPATGVRRDIEGLGAISFEAMTSAEAPTDRATGEAILAAAPASTSEINRVISAALWADVSKPYRSAGQFAQALSVAVRSSKGQIEPEYAELAPQVFEPSIRDLVDHEASTETVEPKPELVDDRVASDLKGLGERMVGDEPTVADADAIRGIEERAAQEADLGAAIEMLESESALHPESARLARLILLYREKLEVVADVLARIEQLEAEGKPEEAAEQRKILKSIHPASRQGVASVGTRPAPPPENAAAPRVITETIDLPDLSEPTQPHVHTEVAEVEPVVSDLPASSGHEARKHQKEELFWLASPQNLPQESPPDPEAGESTQRQTGGQDMEAAVVNASPVVNAPAAIVSTPDAAASAQDHTVPNSPGGSLRPRVASLSASVKSHLQQLSATETDAQPDQADALTEPVAEKTVARPKWLYIAGIVAFALLMLVIAVLFSGSGGQPTVDVRKMEIRAYPPQAEILIDGELCGPGECATELEFGVHRVTARLAGFESEFDVFEVEAPREGLSAADAPPQRLELYLTALFPSLEIESDLATGTVFLDDVNVGEIEDGSFSLDELPDGTHTIRLRSGSVQTTIVVEIEAGSAPVVTSVSSRESKVLVASSLASTAMFWSSTPTAMVSVDGDEKGSVSPEGLSVEGLTDGPHHVGMAGSGAIASFSADNHPRLALSIDTDRNVGGLRIVTGQDGATVYLNDRPYRRKTTRGALLVFLYPGTYRVRVEKPGFVSTPEYSVDITKGTREVLAADLAPQPQLATLTLTDAIPGSQVRIDGELVGEVSSSGNFSYQAVRAGSRVIQIGKDGYRNRTETLKFEIGQESSIDGALVRSIGTLTVSVAPADVAAHLVVRDSQGAIVQLENRAATLPEGGYRIEASANGFRSITSDVRVVGGENVVAEIRLESLTAPKPTGPQDLTVAFSDDPAWSRRGEDLIRQGGGVVLVPAMGAGKYRFSVNLLRGRRLQWVTDYIDGEHYGWFQMGRDNFIRSIVSAGQRSKPFEKAHGLADFRIVTIEIEVGEDQMIHRLLKDGEWVELDRWKFTGANFVAGQFGFRLPGRDELAVRSLEFIATP
jgi:hypothetical protein